MFDNKTLKVQSTRETLFPRLKSVCVCVFARARACVCVCVCAPCSKTDKQSTLWASVRPNDQIHTKHVKMASLESITECFKVNENSWEKIVCVNILS